MPPRRRFTTEEKAAIVGRIKAGESVAMLALETGYSRANLYNWIARDEAGWPPRATTYHRAERYVPKP